MFIYKDYCIETVFSCVDLRKFNVVTYIKKEGVRGDYYFKGVTIDFTPKYIEEGKKLLREYIDNVVKETSEYIDMIILDNIITDTLFDTEWE